MSSVAQLCAIWASMRALAWVGSGAGSGLGLGLGLRVRVRVKVRVRVRVTVRTPGLANPSL